MSPALKPRSRPIRRDTQHLEENNIMDVTLTPDLSGAAALSAAGSALGRSDPAGLLSTLSTFERGTLRTLARAFAGGLGTAAAAELRPGPFATSTLARYPGSGAFASLSGALVGNIAQRFNDALFRDTVNNLLDDAGTHNPYAGILRSAFDAADLSAMDSGERSQFLGMLSLAVASGGPNLQQAQALLGTLAASQSHGWGFGGGLQAAGQMSYQMTGAGTANVNLGDGYSLHINQANSEVDLIDNNTGHTTTIWGDPHMGMDGNNNQFQFKGNITLNLPDGTRITVQTTPWQNNPNAYLTQNLVITRGSQAIVVKDMDQNSADAGKMTIQQSNNAGQLERLLNPDGTELYLNQQGNGWDVLQNGLFMRPMTEQDLVAGDQAQANGTAQSAWNLGVMMALFSASLSLTSLEAGGGVPGRR
jgi:Domain of Unknown Function (DUF1521)